MVGGGKHSINIKHLMNSIFQLKKSKKLQNFVISAFSAITSPNGPINPPPQPNLWRLHNFWTDMGILSWERTSPTFTDFKHRDYLFMNLELYTTFEMLNLRNDESVYTGVHIWDSSYLYQWIRSAWTKIITVKIRKQKGTRRTFQVHTFFGII